MTQIGIYRIDENELELPAEQRTHYRLALYDTTDGWDEHSNESFIAMAPEEKTVKTFVERYGTHRTVVATPEDILGDIKSD